MQKPIAATPGFCDLHSRSVLPTDEGLNLAIRTWRSLNIGKEDLFKISIDIHGWWSEKTTFSIEKDMLHLSSIFQAPSSRFCPSLTGNLRGKSMVHGMKSHVFCHQIEVVPRIGWIKTYHAWRPMDPSYPSYFVVNKKGCSSVTWRLDEGPTL